MGKKEDYLPAIDKLHQLVGDHDSLCIALETGEFKIKNVPKDRVDSLIGTYKYWVQCCSIAAWLLQEEMKK